MPFLDFWEEFIFAEEIGRNRKKLENGKKEKKRKGKMKIHNFTIFFIDTS